LLFPAERLDEYRAGSAPFPSVRLNQDTIVDLFPKKMWWEESLARKGRESLNHFCIAMGEEDWSSLLERLKTYDVEVEEGPVLRWGAHGSGTSVYFRDPEGNRIEIRYYADQNESEKCVLGS
jgi:catechol 2,3-dioxygenase-like lactoylglutathione lyase family enzyme